jgi:glycosyltransferase involved in cell wall biosynthesis
VTRWAILTGEYPPQPGGVSDYTRLVARGLAAAGDGVAVYAPPAGGPDPADPGVVVRRLPDHFGPRGLLGLDRALARRPRSDRVLVQYVPHAFGWRAMNLPFAGWVAARAARLSRVWVMFHEVAAPFGRRPAHAVRGTVNRAMARLVAGAAERVFVSIPAWAGLLRRVCPRAARAEWLPAPCSVDTAADPAAVAAARGRYAAEPGARLVGHFGTFGPLVADLLGPVAGRVLRDNPAARLLLIGRGSGEYRERLAAAEPDLAGRLAAAGGLPAAAVAAHLRACDVLAQPYPDGVSARRTSVMAGLANGVPVVTNLGFLSEPLWASAAGVVVAPGPAPEAVAAAAGAVLGMSDAARAELGRRGAELYAATFALERTIGRLRDPGPGRG